MSETIYAFPFHTGGVTHPGMTLRDYFACHLMAARYGNAGVDMGDVPPLDAARLAYKRADAMLKAREASDDGCAPPHGVTLSATHKGAPGDEQSRREALAYADGKRHGRMDGAEAMRAACLAAIMNECSVFGLGPAAREAFKRSIEGAAL